MIVVLSRGDYVEAREGNDWQSYNSAIAESTALPFEEVYAMLEERCKQSGLELHQMLPGDMLTLVRELMFERYEAERQRRAS